MQHICLSTRRLMISTLSIAQASLNSGVRLAKQDIRKDDLKAACKPSYLCQSFRFASTLHY